MQVDNLTAYRVRLESPVATSFRCVRAADSLDIDTAKKSVHEITVEADIESPWALGVIVGASGSGKTTLARQLWGADSLREILDPAVPVIDQFPEDWEYDRCAAALSGVGLTSVPCWIRPAYTLSNGQRARAEAALQMARDGNVTPVVLDEWTSVVDRTVGKVMSHCVQKYARRTEGARVVLLSCHYDVLDWINPDWVIDCNTQTYTDRRSLWRDFKRDESLSFEIREVDRHTWAGFSRYHYLSDKLPTGRIFTFGLFHGANQIGFQCFANYVPPVKGRPVIMHSNRTVVHPDYAGLGMGMRLISLASAEIQSRGYRVMAKYSSTPVFRAMSKDPAWRHLRTQRQIGRTAVGGNLQRGKGSFRENVKTYSFEYAGQPAATSR